MYIARLHIPSSTVQKKRPLLQVYWEKIKSSIFNWWNAVADETVTNRPVIVRALWMASILAIIAAGVHAYFHIFQYVNQGRRMMEKAEIDARIAGIPLPAVIVCTFNWVNEKKLKNLFDLDNNDPTIDYMKSITSRGIMEEIDKQMILPLENITQFNDTYHVIKERWREVFADQEYSDQAFFTETSYKCGEVLSDCVWNSYSFDCCEEHKPIFTPHGRCLLIKIPHKDTSSGPPAIQNIAGPKGGLSVRLLTVERSASTKNDSYPTAPTWHRIGNGAVLFLADPMQLANRRSSPIAFHAGHPLFSPLASHSFIHLRAIKRIRSASICKLQPTLKYFPAYSEEACECECRINASMAVFNCAMLGDSAGAVHDSGICQGANFHQRFIDAADGVIKGGKLTSINQSISNPFIDILNDESSNEVTNEMTPQQSTYEKGKKLVIAQYYSAFYNCSVSCPISCSPFFQFAPTVTYASLQEETIGSVDGSDAGLNETAVEIEQFSRITIFYSRLYYEVWFERPESSIWNLLSSLGGALALWAGVSVITLIKVILRCVWAMSKARGSDDEGNIQATSFSPDCKLSSPSARTDEGPSEWRFARRSKMRQIP